MDRHRTIGAGGAVALVATLIVGSGVAAQSPVASGGPGANDVGRLAAAVELMPPGATEVAFTDWARIRASLGAEDITGASPIDDKVDVVLATNQQEAATSGFGAAWLKVQHDTWGWDTLDVDWEATYSWDGPPVSVVRLRDGTDMDAITAHYDEREFTTEQVPGATIRSHELDLTSDWMRSGELGVLNTAFLDDGRTLVFSSSPDALRSALDDTPWTPLPGQADVVDALEGASAAWLVLDPGGCVGFSPLPFDALDPDASIAPLATGAPLHPWTALGVAYERPDWTPVGRIAMGFLDADQATADADARTALARDGISQRVRAPYSEAVFTVDDSRIDGQVLLLGVSPVDDLARRLFQMPLARDMIFAGC